MSADPKQTAHTPDMALVPCSQHYDCLECSEHLDACLEAQAAHFRESHDKLVEALEAMLKRARDVHSLAPLWEAEIKQAEAALRAAKGE